MANLEMTRNSQLSLHTGSNIVLVLFLDRLKAFQPAFQTAIRFSKPLTLHLRTQQASSRDGRTYFQLGGGGGGDERPRR